MLMYEIQYYIDDQGRSPFAKWFDSLSDQVAERVLRAVERMEDGNLGDHHGVGQGVMEHRIHSGPGYRIYFGRKGNRLIVLLGGGTKRRQQADIRRALAAWAAHKNE